MNEGGVVRVLGFMSLGVNRSIDEQYLVGRYTQPPADLWQWLEDYLDDEEVSTHFTLLSVTAASHSLHAPVK